jgi:hypothetical protein
VVIKGINMTLQEIEQGLIANKNTLKTITHEYNEHIEELVTEHDELIRRKEMLLNRLDVDLILKAESILKVRYVRAIDFDEWPLLRFIEMLTLKHLCLHTQYPLVKNYMSFTHQHEWCEYGSSPRYGNVVCCVELHKPELVLSDEDVEACLYYLNWMLNKDGRELIHSVN